jgi:hypothetical protein
MTDCPGRYRCACCVEWFSRSGEKWRHLAEFSKMLSLGVLSFGMRFLKG